MDRRNFLKSSCLLCGGAVVGSMALLESCGKGGVSPSAGNVNFTLDLSQSANAALKSAGGSVISHSVIVVNTGSGFVALSDICTHQGCSVFYNASGHDLVCPCHGGTYNLSGTVIAGPPPAPLKKYNISQSGNILTISG
ncbi:MAG: Rieske 2Fe-2S domain-containing protein [Bacteroidales bacterium]|nr:Rieske 2Fe-2S domain-containing protein [Bacteroidales bacterium]